jgi:integrase
MSVFKRDPKTGRTVKDNQPGVWYYNFQHKGQRYIQALPGITSKAQAKAIEQAKRFEVFSGVAAQQETRQEIQRLTEQVSALQSELAKKISESNKAGDKEIPFERFVETWLTNKRIANKDSFPDYEHASKLYLKQFKGRMLHAITTADVESFRQARAPGLTNRGTPRAKATLDKEIAILSGLFSMGRSLGYIRSNPCKGVKLYRPDNGRLVILEDDQVPRLLDALAGEWKELEPLILLYKNTGARLFEVAELLWENVIFSDNEEDRAIRVLGKRKKWREVPLNETAYAVLKELRATCDGKGRVFPEWNRARISRQVSKMFDEIGMPDLTTHSLRHTFASTLARQGDVNPEQLRLLMGHSDLRTTQRYFHLNKKSLRETVKKLENR